MSHALVEGILIGVPIGILIDGLLFDWPFRKSRKRTQERLREAGDELRRVIDKRPKP